MKRILFAAALLALFTQSASAQSRLLTDEGTAASGAPAAATGGAKRPAAAPRPMFTSNENRLDYVAMSSAAGKAVFSGLEALGDLKAVVTNAEGRTVLSTFLNSRQNALNTGRLNAGLYYITLLSETSGRRRSFVLNL